jgi:multiple sugar transport system permease protein
VSSLRGSIASAATRQTRGRRRLRVLEGRRLPYLLILPALCFELLIHIIPLLAGVGISFLQLNQYYIRNWTQAPWVGLHNYALGLQFNGPIGKGVLHSFEITLGFTVLVVGIAWAMGMAAALLVNTEFRGQRWFRTFFLIPYAMPVYVGVIAWSFMLDRDNGSLNRLLVDDLHVYQHRPFWLLGGNAFWSIVMPTVWRLWPFAFLMTLAGMQNIPGELYEAAVLDGTSPWQALRRITLPLARPGIAIAMVQAVIATLNVFDQPYVLNGSADTGASLTMQTYFISFQNLDFGEGYALSLLITVATLIISLGVVRLVYRQVEF